MGTGAWVLTRARLKQEENLSQVWLTEVDIIACQLQLPLQHQEQGTPCWERRQQISEILLILESLHLSQAEPSVFSSLQKAFTS